MAVERKKSWFSDDDESTDDENTLTDETLSPSQGKMSSIAGHGKDRAFIKSGDQNAKLVEYIDKVEPLVMSINTLYNQFAAGVEQRPPLEKLAQLEYVMKILNNLPKTSPTYLFRYKNVQGLYSSYKARWNKLMQDLESGKIKRFADPKNRSRG